MRVLCYAIVTLGAVGCLPDGDGDGDGGGLAGDGVVLDGAVDGSTGDGPVADALSSDVATPDGALLDGATADGAPPDGARLDGADVDGAVLDGATPDGAVPDGATRDVALGDGPLPDGPPPDGAAAGCGDDDACPDGMFCERPAGMCGLGEGECRPRPEGCPEHEDPVCGCDGQTYGNDCNRQMAGVQLDRDGPCEIECMAPVDCADRFWNIRCLGHWSCADFRCEEVCDDVGCGDGVCDRDGGETPTSCFRDCEGRDDRCDDGTDPVCAMPEPECAEHELAAVQGNCWVCVNPDTCHPWGEPGCEADADCPGPDACDGCGSSSCPDCDDCVPACRPHGCESEPEPACDEERPVCPDGQVSVVADGCWLCVRRDSCEAPDCVAAGDSVPVIPGAPECCPGLEPIGCDRPVDGVCPAEPCVGAVVCAACGDEVCGAGENPCNCPADCPGARPCDDGQPVLCDAPPPICEAGSVLAAQDGCWACVNPATCRAWGEPGCADDADCPAGDRCDPCGTGSCPACEDCVPACRPRPIQWYRTCGDPVCGGHTPREGERRCDGEAPGQACVNAGALCDPGDGCNARLLCADQDPRMGGCPISKLEVKRDVRYVGADERARLAASLDGVRLATWRYVGGKDRHLGFVIDDAPPPEALRGDDQVELYGYLSLAVAALQEQRAQIERLEAEVDALRRRVEAR